MKLLKLPETKPTIRFNAKLFRTLLILPKNASAKLRSRDMTMVEGTINSFPFRAALKPNGKGSYQLRLNKAMYRIVTKDGGETVAMEITRVRDEPETRVPLDLRKALGTAPRARVMWLDITPLARRDWIFWIISARQLETRKRRIEKACSKLASGMRRVCCFAGIHWLM